MRVHKAKNTAFKNGIPIKPNIPATNAGREITPMSLVKSPVKIDFIITNASVITFYLGSNPLAFLIKLARVKGAIINSNQTTSITISTLLSPNKLSAYLMY